MDNLMYLPNIPGLENSRAARIGQRLLAMAFALRVLNGFAAAALLLVVSAARATAQTPTGSFFNGNSSQLGNSLRSVTFFLAAAMIIAGIIFIAVGIITSGLRESLRPGSSSPARLVLLSVVCVQRSTRSVRATQCRWIIRSKSRRLLIVYLTNVRCI